MNQNDWNELLKKAALGDSSAQNEAAMWLEEGYQDDDFNIQIDLKEAAHWYLESAKLGNSYSEDAISRLYSTGQGIELDYEKAIEWANRSIRQGNATAAHNLGTVYRDLGKLEKAFEYYSLSLELGNSSASLEIGLCHYFGIGTSVDPEKANFFFEKLIKENLATASEIDEANYWVGISYLMGNGYIQSISKARKYFLKANIDQDHEASQLMLNLIGR